MMRRAFSQISQKDAYDLVPMTDTTPWQMNTVEQPPSDILLAILDRRGNVLPVLLRGGKTDPD